MGCKVKVNINEQEDGTWMITSCFLEHSGHETSEKNYLQQNKNITDNDKDIVHGLVDAQATNKNIAEVLAKKTGKPFNSQDVRNIVTRIKESSMDTASIEEVLADIKENGGNVV